jgi:glycosyltransferase involved in cell wall biosynthesis
MIGTAGFWNNSRDPYRTFDTFVALATLHPDWKFSWGGNLQPELQSHFEGIWFKKFKNLDRIQFLSFIPAETFGAYLQKLNAFLYFRSATSGESSGLVIECANQGTPIVLTAIGSHIELNTPPFQKVSSHASVDEIVEVVEEVVCNLSKRLVTVEGLKKYAEGRDMDSYRKEITQYLGL